ncbi:MAG: protein kinase domain-containing protein [Candidatus Omnitrophota bacterium]
MKKKILLVEYARSTIEIIKETLNSPIFQIKIVGDGEAAKKCLAEDFFDLIITAAMLPKFHGFNLSLHVASNYPGMKILILSSTYKGNEYKRQAIDAYKADDFFEVPFDREQLKERIIQLLNLTDNDLKQALTSEDLFGDIIQKVRDSGMHENAERNVQNSSETCILPSIMSPMPPMSSGEASATRMIPSSDTQIIVSPMTQILKNKTATEKPVPDVTHRIDPNLLKVIRAEEKEKTERTVSRSEEDASEFGGYELLELIGRGGMAEIYKAKRKGVKGFEKIIALKKILTGFGNDPNLIEMFVDEARIAAQLSHPNIVQIYDFDKKDDYYFIAMEYVHGKNLGFVLQKLSQKGTCMPEVLSIYLMLKILEALNYAHCARSSNGERLQIVHRDVSPSNILVSFDGNIKLTDFGISMTSRTMNQTQTAPSSELKGKLAYMSPEQARKENTIDARSDLYSAGIIFYELVIGRKLFHGDSDPIILQKIKEGEIVKPTHVKQDIDPELEAILLKALEKDIEKRYQRASDIIEALDTYLVKNYVGYPEPGHIADYICVLFAEEIAQEGIDIPIRPALHPIRKVQKETVKSFMPSPELIENPSKTIQFRPHLDLRFEKTTPMPEPTKTVSQPSLPNVQAPKRKKKSIYLLILLILLSLLAIIIAFSISLYGSPGFQRNNTPEDEKKINKNAPKEDLKLLTSRDSAKGDRKPTAKEEEIFSLTEVDTPPVPVSKTPITLPHGIERFLFNDEQILVSYVVDGTGNVAEVNIIKKSDIEIINKEIEKTIMQWKFKPATKDNVKVKVWKNQWIRIEKTKS